MQKMISESDDRILVTIKQNSLLFKRTLKSIYVPKQANVNYLRTFISSKYAVNSKDSIFLFAYNSVLNNNDTMDYLYQKFKSRIKEDKGLEINVAPMASF